MPTRGSENRNQNTFFLRERKNRIIPSEEFFWGNTPTHREWTENSIYIHVYILYMYMYMYMYMSSRVRVGFNVNTSPQRWKA